MKWKSKHRRKRGINRVPITSELKQQVLAHRRDEIIEKDEVYVSNVRALNRRIWSGKVPKWSWKALRDASAMHALRRAGISLKESTAMMAL